MYEFLYGKIDELTPAKLILDVNGVGYDLNISLNTFSALQGKEAAKVYVVENIREDAWVLFGFCSKMERELFLLLTSVSGIGGSSARMMLSALTPAELSQAISGEDERILTTIKGIGKRSAQRIIVELKDKVGSMENGAVLSAGAAKTAKNPSLLKREEEAVQALTMLGFPPVPSKKVVVEIIETHPDTKVEDIIKQALKRL